MKNKNFKRFLNIFLIIFSINIQQVIFFKNYGVLKAEEIGIDYLNKDISDNDYILGIGDVIKLVFSNSLSDVGRNYLINSSGTIYLDNIGRVYIKDLTINELKKILELKLVKYIKDPNIDIHIHQHRPVRVVVEGEIDTPGFYTLPGEYINNNNQLDSGVISQVEINDPFAQPLPSDDFEKLTNQRIKSNNLSSKFFPTLFDIIRSAGGVTSYSDLTSIKVIRRNNISNGGGKRMANIDFLSFINGEDLSQNIRVYDGDIIKIKKNDGQLMGQLSKAIRSNLNPKFIRVAVAGEVLSPGIKQASKQSTLNDAIQLAGGLKPLRGIVKFTRFESDGSVQTRKINYRSNRKRGSYQNPYLKNGDIITVGISKITAINQIVSGLTGPIIPLYTTYEIFN